VIIKFIKLYHNTDNQSFFQLLFFFPVRRFASYYFYFWYSIIIAGVIDGCLTYLKVDAYRVARVFSKTDGGCCYYIVSADKQSLVKSELQQVE